MEKQRQLRSSRIVVLLVLGVVLVSITAWYWHRGGEGIDVDQPAAVADAVAESAAKPGPRRIEAGSDPGFRMGRSQTAVPLAASTFPQLAAALDSGDLTAGEAAYFKHQAALMCEGFQGYVPGPELDKRLAPGSPGRVSADTVFAFTQRFCIGEIGHWSEQFSVLSSLPSSDPLVEALEASSIAAEGAQGDMGVPSAEMQMAFTTLDKAMWESTGAASLLAADAMDALGHLSARTKEVSRRGGISLNDQDALAAQRVAVRMAACRQLGGCGPGQLLSLMQCRTSNSCIPGITASQSWRRSYSPAVLEAARQIDASRAKASSGQ